MLNSSPDIDICNKGSLLKGGNHNRLYNQFSVFEFFMWLLGRRLRYRIHGNSMVPTFTEGQEVLLNPKAYLKNSPKQGDIIICEHPYHKEGLLLKRVHKVTKSPATRALQITIYGDNLSESTDSHSFGPLPCNKVMGKVPSRFN